MVLDNGLGRAVKGILGYEDESSETGKKQDDVVEDNIVEEEFDEIYDDEVISALKSEEYGKAEDLLEPTEEFDKVMEDYIKHRLTSATEGLESFGEVTEITKELVENAAAEVKTVEEDKGAAKPSLSLAGKYVRYFNSEEGTQAIRDAFEDFHRAGHAADYIQKRQDIELSNYDSEKVKIVSGGKARDLIDLDREIDMNFMVPEFNHVVEEYNSL